jgi:hypothetical protein
LGYLVICCRRFEVAGNNGKVVNLNVCEAGMQKPTPSVTVSPFDFGRPLLVPFDRLLLLILFTTA